MFDRRDTLGRDLFSLQQEMDRFMQHLSHGKRPLAVLAASGWRPNIDVYETESEIVVVVESAGMTETDIEALADGKTLLLRGQRLSQIRTRHLTYHQLEIGFGRFERAIDLPTSVDPERATASCANGFLEIVLPKVASTSGRRVAIRPAE